MGKFWKPGMARVVVAAAVVLWCFSPSLGKPPKPPGGGGGGGAAYTIVPFLPPDLASNYSNVSDLNDQGHAVGFVRLTNGDFQAVHLDMATGVYTALQGGAFAGGVNNLNQIVGDDGAGSSLFWSSPTAQPVTLPPLSGDTETWISAVNDDGMVVGTSLGPNQPPQSGVVWRVVVDANGAAQVSAPVPLPPLTGDLVTSAGDINNVAGGFAQVTGASRSDGLDEAVLWTVQLHSDGTISVLGPPLDLGTLELLNPSQSDGAGINQFGDVCGGSDLMACVWPADSTIQQLPKLSDTQGGFGGFAAEINDLREIVGQVDVGKVRPHTAYTPDWHACLWKNGQVIDLATQIGGNSGWSHLWGAHAINNSGVIAGLGRFDTDNRDRGFLLIPTTP